MYENDECFHPESTRVGSNKRVSKECVQIHLHPLSLGPSLHNKFSNYTFVNAAQPAAPKRKRAFRDDNDCCTGKTAHDVAKSLHIKRLGALSSSQ